MRESGDRGQVVERWNDVFRAISTDPRRRLVLSLMGTDDGEAVPLPEGVAGPRSRLDSDEFLISLRHQHLPRLADDGFVRWESDPLVASRGPRFDEVAAVLGALEDYASELPTELVSGCPHLEVRR